MAKDENGKWITVKGTHVFIPDGKRPSEVLKSKFKLKGTSTEKFEKDIKKNERQYENNYKANKKIKDIKAKSNADMKNLHDYKVNEEDIQYNYMNGIVGNETKGLQNALPQRTAPKGELSGMEATNALNKLEAGMPVMVKYGKDFEPKQAIYLGRNDDGRFAFYDGGGVTGRFDFGEQWLKDNPNVSFNFEDNDPIEWNRLNQEIKGNTENKPLKNFNEGWNDEDKKDYMNIPQEERVKAYEEGKNWKDLVNEKKQNDDFENWKEENNEKIASYYTETYSDDLKNINEDVWNSIAKDIYDEEKLPEKINKEYYQNRANTLELRLDKIHNSLAKEHSDQEDRRLNEEREILLRELDDLYNTGKAKETSPKANKETMNSTPKRLGSWRTNENGKKEYYERELGDNERGYWTKENGQRVFKENPNYKEDDDFESVSKELSEIANRTGKHDFFSEAGKRWNELYNQDKNNVSKDLGDGYSIGVGYGGTISMRSTHPYDETDYAYAEKNNGKWVVRNPLTNARTTFDTRDEALQEMKAIDKIIKTGEPVMDNEGVSRYLPPKNNESSWSRKMRENKAKTVDEREKNLRDTLKTVKLRKKINEQAKRRKK